MIKGKATEDAEKGAAEIDVLGQTYRLTGFVGAAPVRGIYVDGNEANDTGGPQGFRVEQPAGAVTEPHFHETNQFQVFVGGAGWFGKHELKPLTVQYANGHSPYGPVVAGPEGLDYFTLRARWDPGAKYMPRSRDRLIKGNQRQRLVTGIWTETAEELKRRFGVDFELFLDAEGDGLAGFIGRFGPGGAAVVPCVPKSGGQYWVVVGGSMVLDGKVYPRLSCLFASADQPLTSVAADADGLELLVLQFPEKNLAGLAA
ncbi:MAG: hypothetical protein VW338_02750 [Rhodospirillaceae bacterium]